MVREGQRQQNSRYRRDDNEISAFQSFVAFVLFFLITVPLTLFILAIAYLLWEWFSGAGWLLDAWTTLIVFPLGLLVSPVFFYLGWYYEARAKRQHFALEKAMNGYFPTFCRTVYGIMAGITILLAMMGVLGSAFIDSSLILVTWLVTAFVGIGIISWLFQSAGGSSSTVHQQSISLLPTGIVFILFSAIWLYVCIAASFDNNQAQLEGGAILFLLFLIPGIVAIRLSSRRSAAIQPRSGDDDDSAA